MDKTQGSGKVFKLNIGGDTVLLRFSQKESDDLKGQLRNILTSAYDERLLGYIAGGRAE